MLNWTDFKWCSRAYLGDISMDTVFYIGHNPDSATWVLYTRIPPGTSKLREVGIFDSIDDAKAAAELIL